MSSDLLTSLLSNIWVVFLVIVLFGGSIFVHELGHFLAARRRGVVVERFSIGFGPPIFKWRGKDGVEYRVAWFPLGGYVLLPQLADLGAVEGRSEADPARLAPVSYATRMIVFVAGAAFNILFAFALACIVWIVGQPTPVGFDSTTIADVVPKLRVDGNEVVSPAAKAGLQSGDVILAIDGKPVTTFFDIMEQLALSSGWNADGERQTILKVRRGEKTFDVTINPVLAGDEKIRRIGITTVAKLIIGGVAPGSASEKAGLRPDDQITAANGTPMLTWRQLDQLLQKNLGQPIELTVLRGTETRRLTLTLQKPADFGLGVKTTVTYTHPTPWAQVQESVVKTFRTLGALVNPRSDINFSHMSGPIGIIDNFVAVSRAGLPLALWFTILVNVNLAIFNLLPIPVLDGGQMLFATIGRLRGRPLPVNFIATAQSVFLVLLLSMVIYVSVFDVRRIVRDVSADRAAEAAAQPAKKAAPTASPEPAR